MSVDIMLNLGNLWVNALDIAEVQTVRAQGRVIVRMRSGAVHTVRPSMTYELTSLETRIIEHINHATTAYSGKVEHAEPKFKPA